VDRKPDLDLPIAVAQPTGAEATPARRAGTAGFADLRTVRADSTWQASSFDLAQGLDVKVMESKLSRETLDQLFRG
jgi:hypothetical protein